MGWLRSVGSIKFYVSFAKEPHKRDYILQTRPVILSILLPVATPYWRPTLYVSHTNAPDTLHSMYHTPMTPYILCITHQCTWHTTFYVSHTNDTLHSMYHTPMTPYTILLYVFVLYIFQLFSRRSYSHSHSMYHISMTSYKHFLIYFSYSTFSRHARALTVTLHSIYRISMTPYMHVCYCIFVSYIFPPYSRRLLAPYILCISMTPRWYTSSYPTFSRHTLGAD